jgi:ATP-dependent Clp protease ATP-binding subunit ClpA
MIEIEENGRRCEMLERLSEESMQIILFAEQEMLRTGHSEISPLHLLLGCAIHSDSLVASFFTASGVTLTSLREAADCIMGTASGRPPKLKAIYG